MGRRMWFWQWPQRRFSWGPRWTWPPWVRHLRRLWWRRLSKLLVWFFKNCRSIRCELTPNLQREPHNWEPWQCALLFFCWCKASLGWLCMLPRAATLTLSVQQTHLSRHMTDTSMPSFCFLQNWCSVKLCRFWLSHDDMITTTNGEGWWVLCQSNTQQLHLTKVQFHPWFNPRIQVGNRVPEDWTQNCCASQGTRCKIRSGAFEGNEEMSFHDVFCHNVAQSYYYGLVVTRGCCTMWSAFIVNEMSILERQSTNMELFLAHRDAPKFLVCVKWHLLCWWNIRVGNFVLKALSLLFLFVVMVNFTVKNHRLWHLRDCEWQSPHLLMPTFCLQNGFEES